MNNKAIPEPNLRDYDRVCENFNWAQQLADFSFRDDLSKVNYAYEVTNYQVEKSGHLYIYTQNVTELHDWILLEYQIKQDVEAAHLYFNPKDLNN